MFVNNIRFKIIAGKINKIPYNFTRFMPETAKIRKGDNRPTLSAIDFCRCDVLLSVIIISECCLMFLVSLFPYLFTARCTLVQSAVLRSHVVCLSVCL